MFSFPMSIASLSDDVCSCSYLKAWSFDFDCDEAAMGDTAVGGFGTCSVARFVLLAFQS